MTYAPAAIFASTADTLLAALDAGAQLPPLTRQPGGLSIKDAYRVSRAVTARRRGRGEQVIGRKIGFTNRTIWDEYGVHHPIDGPMYDTTVTDADGPVQGVSLARFVEPRIEPEIVLGLSAAPSAGMDEAALMGCIGWIAHGFEIVQSLYPGWVFSGLHGALFCGPRRRIAAAERADMLAALTRFEITLSRGGEVMDRGKAENVLGGPVSALRHLVAAIAADAEAEPLKAGDVITTCTVTRAFPIVAGERWTTAVEGLPLPGMDVSFVA
jgi:2-oxo-3-hexenedioate decarboxylase